MVLPKSKNAVGLGNSLMNDRFGGSKGGDRKKVSARQPGGVVRTNHATGEAYVTNAAKEASWVKMRSVTEQGALEEFLSTAELAGTDFTAEKMNNVKIIHTDQNNPYLLSAAEERGVRRKQAEKRGRLTVPRRPKWDENTTPQELDEMERAGLLEWRRGLAELQESDDLLMTPFERNIEVWRQLWRVIERSELIVQIVDARNPLLFRSADLEAYVKEVDPKKRNLLLVNKADMMTEEQRRIWARYFEEKGINYRFFSAYLAKEMNEGRLDGLGEFDQRYDGQLPVDDRPGDSLVKPVDARPGDSLVKPVDARPGDSLVKPVDARPGDSLVKPVDARPGDSLVKPVDARPGDSLVKPVDARPGDSLVKPVDARPGDSLVKPVEGLSLEQNEEDEDEWSSDEEGESNASYPVSHDSTRILTVDELETLFLENVPEDATNERKTTIGLVGYPNVGKSSTINALIGAKKVSVSATPGKTKHFQTIHLSDRVILCDCPGLVFPNFATTKAELVCSGVLPIDQLREFSGPAGLVAQRIPQAFLENVYGMKIQIRPTEEGGTGTPTASELLRAYAKARGFATTGHGQPDESRAARYILKDYVNGKLLYCHPPPHEPEIDGADFNKDLYDFAHLPAKRQAWLIAHSDPADASTFGDETSDAPLPLLPRQEGGKSRQLDSKFFAASSGNVGHVLNHKYSERARKPLTGRKAKAMDALEKDIDPAELQAGNKKHFKASRTKTRKTRGNDD
ncbi:hypothetical protein DV735_g2026, partial [Chaetothyriales sp. CBS 134920]